MHEADQERVLPGRPDRRTLLKAAAVTGGAVWAAPAILSLDAAAASTCCAATGPGVLLPTCQPEINQPDLVCTTQATGSTQVCRLQGQQMLLSRDALGTQEPYADELVTLTVIPPVGSAQPTQIQNFIRWEPDCRDTGATLPDVTLVSNDPCGTTGVAAVDVTAMFGTDCGIFTVNAVVRNAHNPFAWSTMFIYPV